MLPRNGDNLTRLPYDDVVTENERLKQQLQSFHRIQHELSSRSADPLHGKGSTYVHEREFYTALRSYQRRTTVRDFSDVLFPSRNCNHVILTQGARWAWQHCAVDPLSLLAEMEGIDGVSEGVDLSRATNSGWLALYFATLTVSSRPLFPALEHLCPDMRSSLGCDSVDDARGNRSSCPTTL